mmetsp:Transcript_21504/g.31838  ORF Transcript_21504/g.31838 Transcript_21504/m.31838 type:complete len:100 (-) Transcript_21504:8-307(-)
MLLITMVAAVEEDQIGIKILPAALLLPVALLQAQVTIATVTDPEKGTLAMAMATATATLPIILMVLFAFDAISQGIMRPVVPTQIDRRCINNKRVTSNY